METPVDQCAQFGWPSGGSRSLDAEAKLAKVQEFADKVDKVEGLVDPCCVVEELRDILEGGA